MIARQYVKMLGGEKVSDTDYEIPEKKLSCKKLKCLQKFGFRLFFFNDAVHIHAPERKVRSFFDRGWSFSIVPE